MEALMFAQSERGLRGLIGAAAFAALSFASAAHGDAVVRWVDANGVTHFGNPQFAPPDAAPVDLEPANGMDVPEYVENSRGDGPNVVTLKYKTVENKRGWRGFESFRANNPVRVGRR
jgi:hypothetical protein